LIPVVVITALPIIRRNNYNTFYYIHIIFVLLVLVLVCLHASTNFYFILPGLILWVYDWSYRVQHALYFKQTIEVESAGNNWYRMRLRVLPRQLLAIIQRLRKGLLHRMLLSQIILSKLTTFA
jgi:ferric-chelate reductase